ncbi:hypothetical protein BFJ68_g1169 [Fusarium oxysporum]|uniref:Uncharacterized protein n=1 Tax=Fusarium oxysporum TaxID=5507 RepID=A0A420S138_FUSOX|nr:hypothetical protein BFJ68_g1169 [Fusarium oxysporum]
MHLPGVTKRRNSFQHYVNINYCKNSTYNQHVVAVVDKATKQCKQRTQNKSEGDRSEGGESEGEASESDESEGDGTSSSTGMDIDLPEPTEEDLTTQISVLHIASNKSNGETHRVTKTAKKRHLDDNSDTDGAAGSGSKRTRAAYH